MVLAQGTSSAPQEIRFYGHRAAQYGYLSNFSQHSFKLGDFYWKTVEHYYQAMKFEGGPLFGKIRDCDRPGEAKRLGQTEGLRPDWESIKEQVMEQALIEKFKQNPQILKGLLETGEATLIEDSPTDYYWGCGKTGKGKNRLGVLLMRVRTYFRNQEGK